MINVTSEMVQDFITLLKTLHNLIKNCLLYLWNFLFNIIGTSAVVNNWKYVYGGAGGETTILFCDMKI